MLTEDIWGRGEELERGHEGIFWVMGIWVMAIQLNTTVKAHHTQQLRFVHFVT